MWTEAPDDRTFLRNLAREVIAAAAPEELDDFEVLIDGYFADPGPPRPRRRSLPPWQTRLSPVAPAVIGAVLGLLQLEIQHVAQYDQADIVRLALKRIVRQRGAHPHERAELCPTGQPGDPALSVVVLLYTRPVAIAVPLSRITSVAYETARIYGLGAARADDLVPLAASRLILGPGAFQSQGGA
ncbi:hypothetical protein K2Z83_05415 [Oscillochloris sp. ZM17-4]|uniref:hypothetical protein n=1 Tax=Oscillochloris sp. ZM17-4 TaxID=2866714 RepID=UPI001C731FF5|nr:hypothetical protein [Oscillochloris sp. ZM17-4]MBX0327120.1 hypothetical protein [Oscillochloris sp. ZM17-4]